MRLQPPPWQSAAAQYATAAALTRARTRKRQVAFLRRNGIRHYLDNDGWPVVLRSAVESPPEVAPTAWKSNKAA